MVAREDDCSLSLQQAVSVSSLLRSTGDHSCVCTCMFFMTGRKETRKKTQTNKKTQLKGLEVVMGRRSGRLSVVFLSFSYKGF